MFNLTSGLLQPEHEYESSDCIASHVLTRDCDSRPQPPSYQLPRAHQAGGQGKRLPDFIDKRGLRVISVAIACDQGLSTKSK
jgi:hypothetical protein